MNSTLPSRLRVVAGATPLLLLTAPLWAQQQPQQETVEQRLERLERLLRQDRMGVQAEEASFSLSFVPADTAGVPDFQDTPRAPGVASTVDLKLWGRANFAANYDNFQGTGGVGGADFANFVTAEGPDEVNFNPRDTRFGFAASNAWDEWTGRAVAEIDFYGTNAGANLIPRMRLGYVEMAHNNGFSLRAGQDWNPIAQQNPGTIDFGILSWSGNAWGRTPQITARYKSGANEFLFGLMQNRTAGTQDQQERMPWVIARYQWTGLMDGKGMIAVGGGVRDATIANATTSANVTNYIGAIEVKVPLCDMVTLNGEVWTGQGIGREFVRGGLDYNSLGQEVAGSGGFVNLAIKATEQVSFNVGVGVDQPDDSDTGTQFYAATASTYNANRAAYANVRYQMSKQTGFGVELMDIETETVAGSILRGQRFTFGTWFIF